MSGHELAMFAHIVGVAAAFAGIGIADGSAWRARKARDRDSLLTLLAFGKIGGPIIMVSSLVLFIAGIYLVEDEWGWDHTWINLSLAAFLVLSAMGPAVIERRMKAITALAAQSPPGPLPQAIIDKVNDPVLAASSRTMLSVTVGIIFLMIVKPSTEGSIATMLVAVAAGLALSVPEFLLRPRTRAA